MLRRCGRTRSLFPDVFDVKTTNLILFGMLLVEHNPAARRCTRSRPAAPARPGKELHKIVELASATGALGPANPGSAMLKTLHDGESR